MTPLKRFGSQPGELDSCELALAIRRAATRQSQRDALTKVRQERIAARRMAFQAFLARVTGRGV
jgi:hypothetical protein